MFYGFLANILVGRNIVNKDKSNLKLRIGVDARLLSEPITGIGRYLHETLSRMVLEGHEWYLYSHRPLIIGDWKHENVFVRNVNLSGRPLRMLWAQSILPYWASRDAIDIFWSPAHRVPRYLSGRIQAVVTIHDLVWRHAGETMRPLSRWLDSRLMLEAADKASVVIAVSKSTANDLIAESGDLHKKIVIIPLGVSHKLLPPLDSMQNISFVPKKPFYLFVGTLEPRKNLNRLIEAVSILPADLKKSSKLLIIGGKGWGNVNINELIRRFELGDSVEVLGYVDDLTLASLYSRAQFLVMPSLYEGFGLPLVEAMAYGVPALTSNRSSMPEVIGNAGVLIDPENIQSIADGLALMLGNDKLRKTLSSEAVKQVIQFDWGVCARKTLRVFENISRSNHCK